MNYSLGNMLGGAGALNADKLALNLQFATDKTLTARKGPTPVFTRASTATFVGSNGLIQSAAINTARFDHDPITLACKGLLIEESRTNLCLQSEDINTTWQKSSVTVSTNTATSPNGGTNADTLTEDSSNNFHYLFQQTTKAASSITYSFSVYYKNASGTRSLVVALTNGTTAGKAAIFSTSGTITATNINVGSGVGFTFIYGDVTNAGNGWYRASIIVTSDTSTRLDAVVYMNNSNTLINSYLGNGTSGIFIWGAQLEAGAFPTSYIPTTTASVVRSADVCSITGSSFSGMYNATEGTLLLSADEFRRGSNFTTILRIADSANPSNNRYSIGAYGSKTGVASPLEFIVVSAAIAQYAATPTSAISNFKAAFAYKVDDMRGAVNGVLATADTPPSALIVTPNTINIGGVGIHIASILYFRKRLANAKLQTLTA